MRVPACSGGAVPGWLDESVGATRVQPWQQKCSLNVCFFRAAEWKKALKTGNKGRRRDRAQRISRSNALCHASCPLGQLHVMDSEVVGVDAWSGKLRTPRPLRFTRPASLSCGVGISDSYRHLTALSVVQKWERLMTSTPPVTARVRGGREQLVAGRVLQRLRGGGIPPFDGCSRRPRLS